MSYYGDFAAGQVVTIPFSTSGADDLPATLAGPPAAVVYRGTSTTEDNPGVAIAVDFDGKTGFHVLTIDTSSDPTFYAAGNDFAVLLTAGTVGGSSIAPAELGLFSIENRSIPPADAMASLQATLDAILAAEDEFKGLALEGSVDGAAAISATQFRVTLAAGSDFTGTQAELTGLTLRFRGGPRRPQGGKVSVGQVHTPTSLTLTFPAQTFAGAPQGGDPISLFWMPSS